MSKPETNPVKRLFNKDGSRKPGMRAAINAMCASCVGCSAQLQGEGFIDRQEDGFRETIRSCAVYGCPIHHLRPYK